MGIMIDLLCVARWRYLCAVTFIKDPFISPIYIPTCCTTVLKIGCINPSWAASLGKIYLYSCIFMYLFLTSWVFLSPTFSEENIFIFVYRNIPFAWRISLGSQFSEIDRITRVLWSFSNDKAPYSVLPRRIVRPHHDPASCSFFQQRFNNKLNDFSIVFVFIYSRTKIDWE